MDHSGVPESSAISTPPPPSAVEKVKKIWPAQVPGSWRSTVIRGADVAAEETPGRPANPATAANPRAPAPRNIDRRPKSCVIATSYVSVGISTIRDKLVH